jgi:hypothetical protein
MSDIDYDNYVPNPWIPMTDPVDISHLGKFNEELSEAGAAASRCLIQGIDEKEPTTGKVNRDWLEDEIADVIALIELNIGQFMLDMNKIRTRADRKKKYLTRWFAMMDESPEVESRD